MSITWIVQKKSNHKVAHNVDGLAEILNQLGINCVRYEHETSFTDEFHQLNVPNPKIYYGSTGLCRLAYTHDPEGLFFDEDNFRTSTWLNKRDDMLNSDSQILTIEEAFNYLNNETNNTTGGTFDEKKKFFLRPNNDLKTFSGMVMPVKEMKEWMQRVIDGKVLFNKNHSVVLSPFKEILFEMRCFLVQGELIDVSVYRYRDRTYQENLTKTRLILPQYKDEFYQKLDGMAKKWLPHEVVVMDVAVLDNPENDMKVVEFNSFNGSGFYDNHVLNIVKAVQLYMENKIQIQKVLKI